MVSFTKLFAPDVAAVADAAAEALERDPGARRGALCPTPDLVEALARALRKRDVEVLDARNLDLYERRDIGGVVGHLRIVSNPRFDGLLDRARSLFPLLDHTLLKDLRAMQNDASAVYDAFMERSGYLDAARAANQVSLVDALERLGQFVKDFVKRSPDPSLAALMADWEAYRLTDGGSGDGVRLHTPESLKGLRLEALAVLIPEGGTDEYRAWIQAGQDHASERVYLVAIGAPVGKAEPT